VKSPVCRFWRISALNQRHSLSLFFSFLFSCTHTLFTWYSKKSQFALPVSYGLCCLVCHCLINIWVVRLTPSCLQSAALEQRCQTKLCMCSSPKEGGDKTKRILLVSLEMWSISTQNLGMIHQEVRAGHRVLSVLKIKTDSLQVTPVSPLVHKYFV